MPKVMLVEDDNNLREIYEARLQAEGYTIVSAKDGEEALVVAKAEKPDLIITDVMMPKISGFEMLDILRNTEGLKDVKVIMLTALGQSDDQQRAEKLGADRYLVKYQVTLEDIVEVAKQLISGESASPKAAEADSKETKAVEPAAETALEAPAAADKPTEPDSEQIENFVAGATSDASTPGQATDTSAPTSITVKSDDSSDGTPATDDDKLMADAVDTLVNDTQASANASKEDATQPTVVTPTETKPETAAEPEPKAESTSQPTDGLGSKKVIKPLDSQPKTDINELLAAEEAKSKPEAPAKPVVGGSGDKKSDQDPSNIAL